MKVFCAVLTGAPLMLPAIAAAQDVPWVSVPIRPD
jgi:hypothetical protein